MPPRLPTLALGLACLLVAAPAATAGVSPKDATLQDHIRPLLAKYCGDCHGPEKPKANLNVLVADVEAIARDRKHWGRVRDYIESGEMPPEDRPQPSADEADLLVRWVDAQLAQPNCGVQVDPGRVTLRRLNRAEYNNTIRDLVGVDFRPAEDFPSDDVGYGFDNIGDVLALPPILLERYLAAAEQVAEKAIVGDLNAPIVVREWALRRSFPSNAQEEREYLIPANGKYRLRARAYGDQAGPEKAKMAFLVDGKAAAVVDVPATEAAPGDYEVAVSLRAGRRKLGVAFTNDYYKPDDPDPAMRGDRNLFVESMALASAVASPSLLPESHRRIITKRPSGNEPRATAAAEVLRRFASRAYRRPVRPDELARLVRFVEMVKGDGGTYEQGIQLAVQAVLVSPHFLFRVEVDRPSGSAPGKVRDLNDFELASRLSYFLWSSMPDDELFRLARDGKLRDPKVLEAQARRMLKDPKASALVDNFAAQWLQIRNLRQVSPDKERFPKFNDDLAASMERETELFFAEIVRADRSILEFLDADYTFVDGRLAELYGIQGVQGDEFRKVKVSDGRRGGILTQASILTVTSNPTRTSPVKRGKWILEQVLGTPPPPAPPDVPVLDDGRRGKLQGTLRQQMEQHRSNPACASCHTRMDPLGFGFENYDAIGAWRDKDGDHEVDASGTLPGEQSFRGPAELKRLLIESKSRMFAENLAEKLLTYALGRGLDANDHCVVEKIAAALPKDGHRFSRLVVEIVKSDPFRKRNVGGEAR